MYPSCSIFMSEDVNFSIIYDNLLLTNLVGNTEYSILAKFDIQKHKYNMKKVTGKNPQSIYTFTTKISRK